MGVENTGQQNNKKENVGTQLFIENYLLQNNLAIEDDKISLRMRFLTRKPRGKHEQVLSTNCA